jgi:hypothetical protein
MYRRLLIARAALCSVTLTCASAFIGCGGPKVPAHDGYRERWVAGWKKPTVLKFDEDYEAEADGELSYPKRQRTRWYAVDLPDDGKLEVQLMAAPLGLQPGETEIEDMDDPFDVGMEIYDEGYKVLTRADRDDEDVGERSKSRTVEQVRRGRYLIHLFLQRRLDEAEFTLRVKLNRGSVEAETDFPRGVAFVDALPVIPAFDDSPEPEKPRCRGSKCGKPADKPADKPKDEVKSTPTASTPAAGSMKVKIVVVRGLSSGGTEITLNRGSAQGVAAGWTGKVVTKSGAAIDGGSFTVLSVKTTTSSARVSLSQDAVKQAGNAILKAP